jgi:signal transduction histidine kinase/CheY-like chemotaxis protein/purine-cytosine permease-like protein
MDAAAPISPPEGAPAPEPAAPQQRVIKVRRDYNAWVASETLEDYALRFTPRSFRKWSTWRVANTALGGAASFLVLEAVGGTLLLQVGFINAALAILATGLIIFAAGVPISIYAARHGLDMDLLTRGAGFGYIGSTITSLIYASFTFIFFALEAAIMAYALELAFDIPPAWGYLLCALVVLPLVTHGVTAISQLQVWTQPLWLLLLLWPYVVVFRAQPTLWRDLQGYAGLNGNGGHFDPLLFGSALTVGIALITQMGEQADYLRFMPEKSAANRGRWWFGVLVGGPGWVVPGVLKMLGGALLAYLALTLAVPADRAVDPNQMYLAAYETVFSHYGWAVAATALLVIVSQIKINVTNAYAGSLAWSNFFARVTHSHPGRVVWVVFNTLIALMLMEMEVFRAIGGVLGLYSNIAISWIMAVVADLVVNKPLGLSPKGIEFKRAHLYDINPVGVGAMGAASLLSMLAYLGVFGAAAQAFSAVIAMAVAFVAAPLIAWGTKGRYYIARQSTGEGSYLGARLGAGAAVKVQSRCVICERSYESEDMAGCPAYGGPICSLCCSLDARCHDLCKPEPARAHAQFGAMLRRLMPRAWWPQLDTGLARYLLLMAVVAPLLGGLMVLLYQAGLRELGGAAAADVALPLRGALLKTYCALLLAAAIIGWWLVLTQISRRVAQEESNRQTEALVREIDSHRRTDEQLQGAKRAADAANQAKTRYISAISHELRTPLNSILGYAQLLDEDPTLPSHRKQAVGVIRRGGEHLLSLIEGTLDIARIEGGKLALEPRPMRLRQTLLQIVQMFELQALSKGLRFEHDIEGAPEVVRADERRLTQILINVLGNAVKFTQSGRVSFRALHLRDMAIFEVEDTGPGIAPQDIERIFEPFSRGSQGAGAAVAPAAGGTGLGLTIAKMLTDLMGGEMTVSSTPARDGAAAPAAGSGTLFRIRLFLPEMQGGRLPSPPPPRVGYSGPRQRVLVVDNEEIDRTLLARRLETLGFEVLQAGSGEAALALLREMPADAILMDLAMPGIDGWETLRSIRRLSLSAAPAAIVSANAFDKGLENDVGITMADFITKPVRLEELLDWLGRRLSMQWLATAPPAPPPPAGPPALPPTRENLLALREVVDLGYPRGVQRQLDRIQAEQPDCAAWLAPLQAMAQAFQFDRMTPVIQEALVLRRSQAL